MDTKVFTVAFWFRPNDFSCHRAGPNHANYAAHGDAAGPFAGVERSVARRARRGFAAAFGGGGDAGARPPAAPPVTVRQVNFWLPHERDGDKCLVLLSREASALVAARDRGGGGGVLTACQLPRTAASARGAAAAGAGLAANRNFHLTDAGLSLVERELPGRHVFAVNRPVIFVSHHSVIGGGRPVWQRADAANAVFHCGAAREGLGHSSTEMRVAVLSRALADS